MAVRDEEEADPGASGRGQARARHEATGRVGGPGAAGAGDGHGHVIASSTRGLRDRTVRESFGCVAFHLTLNLSFLPHHRCRLHLRRAFTPEMPT